MELIALLMIPLGLWIISLGWLQKWKYFKKFFLINLALVISYAIWLIQSELEFLGVDPYGLGALFFIISIVYGHVLIVFVFAIFMRIRPRRIVS